MTGLEIRAATAADSDTVCRVAFSLLEPVGPGECTHEILRPATEQMLGKADDVFAFLAFHEGRPVGLIVLNRCTALGEFGETTEL